MYKELSLSEFKEHMHLPKNYKVEAFISYGGWNDRDFRNNIKKALKDLKIKYTSQSMKKYYGFLSDILEVKIKNKIYWFTIAYGGVKLSEYTHLACILGSKMNIHTGSCGGLYPELNSLDILLPTWTYGQESSASMYDRSNKNFKYHADIKLSKKLEQKAKINNKTWNGPIISCHAMLGETLNDVNSWSKEGYHGVEMETATVFSISKHFNVPSASILYVSDNLIKGQISGDKSHENERARRKNVRQEIYEIAIREMLGFK